MSKLTKDDLDAASGAPRDDRPYIKVGMSSCGIAAGADAVFKVFKAESEKRKIDIAIKQCGCSGACHAEPLVEVFAEGLPSVVYGRVTSDIALRILEEHVRDKRIVQDFVVDMPVRR